MTASSATYASHKEYMDSLVPPSHDEFEKIASVQQEREAEMRLAARQARRSSSQQIQQQTPLHNEDRRSSNSSSESKAGKRRKSIDTFKSKRAAKLIQRTYRGYRLRREMRGLGLDASTRWVSAIQEARFREMSRPLPRTGLTSSGDGESLRSGNGSESVNRGATAREKWRKAAFIAKKAGHDDSDSDLSSMSSEESEETHEERVERRKRREEAIKKRKETSMMMGLQYFLEMLDQKHRYGSNLRVYHEEWKSRDTHENFFYWLDHGEGRFVDMAACPRDRLERELVRYLSREERQYYLVTIDDDGRLCWAKDGCRINTTEDYRDSIRGIVPIDDPTPAWTNSEGRPETPIDDANSARSASSIESAREADRAAKYATPEFDDAKAHRKVMKLSAGTIFDKLLRKTVRKNTWIFVADTNFRLYVGIKASGAFQHSSFLQGSRISAAGLIKIKDGRLTSLSPLSGHYRPPASNFRAFIRSMKEAGTDVSHVSVSKSYTVLVGLETYMKTRNKGKHVLEKLTAKKEKIVAPEEVARREEEQKDKSASAAREREVLEEERRRQEEERKANSKRYQVVDKLRSVRDGDGGIRQEEDVTVTELPGPEAAADDRH